MSNFLYPQNDQPAQYITNQKTVAHRGLIIISAIILGLLLGCADHYAENRELLTKDYQSLSDQDLTLYYNKLEDQIRVVERDRNKSSFRFGFGIGGYGSNYGGSSGADITTPDDHIDVITNLRDRHNDVKLEMRKRNLNPQ